MRGCIVICPCGAELGIAHAGLDHDIHAVRSTQNNDRDIVSNKPVEYRYEKPFVNMLRSNMLGQYMVDI